MSPYGILHAAEVATRNDHVSCVQVCMLHATWLRRMTYYCCPGFFLEIAARHNSDRVVQALLQSGADPRHTCDRERDNRLRLPGPQAARKGHVPVMRVLLQARISPQSLVLDAVEHSRTDALELLLQCKADVMTDTTHVLHSAFSTICTRTLDVLLSAKAAVNAEFCGQTALRVAVQADHVPLIRQLIQAKAHVDADAFTRNPQEGTPLICAVRRGFVRAARLLLCAKADTQRTSKFCTPLFIATSLSNVRMMRVLLDAKANVDDGGISDGGSSGFFLGPTPHPDPDFDLGAGPCGRKRPLLAESANLAAVRTLVKAKADVNRTGGVCYPYPPAHTAILRDNLPMLDLLLAHGARTDVCIQPFGWNLLHTAVWMDSKRIVRRLVGLCPALLCGRTTSCWQGLQVGAGLLPVDLARRKDPSCRMRDLLVTAYAPGICSD